MADKSLAKIQHLLPRKGRYWARLAVPEALRPVIMKRELTERRCRHRRDRQGSDRRACRRSGLLRFLAHLIFLREVRSKPPDSCYDLLRMQAVFATARLISPNEAAVIL
jgi:hypothetical protein